MRKTIAFVCVLLLLATVPFVAAFAENGVTVRFDENPNFSITADGIQKKYFSGDLGYGKFHALFFDAGAKITFNAAAELNNMGAPTGTVTAGTVKDISEIDGWYVYLGEPSASTYLAFVGPASASLYTPPNLDLPASIPAIGAAAPAAPGPAAGAPPELATLFNVGKWPLAAGTYDPALDGTGIPNGASVYGLFDAAYAPLEAPTSIAGFKSVNSVSEVVKGTYNVHYGSSGYNYVIIGLEDTTPSSSATAPTIPAAPPVDSSLPPELAKLFNVGKWPLPAGSYDPALDGIGIPDGASVFGLFDAAYAALEAPKTITGYGQVSSVAQVAKGTFNIHNGSSGFNYVIIGLDETKSSGGATQIPSPPPGVTMIPDDFDMFWFVGSDIPIGIKSYGKLYYDFDLASAGFGTGHVYALYFKDDGQIVFAQGVSLMMYDASMTQVTKTAAPGQIFSIAELNGFTFGLGNTSNSLCFVQESNPLNYAGLVPDKPFEDISSKTPPIPLEFKIKFKERTDVELTLYDSNAMYGYYYLDIANSSQMAYLLRLKEKGTVTFSAEVTVKFANSTTGEINDSLTTTIPAGTVTPIAKLHGARWYLGNDKDSEYVVFIDDSSTAITYVPPKFYNPNDINASMTNYKASAINELADGVLRPYSVFGGSKGISVLLILLGGIALAIPIGIAIYFSQRREVKSGGSKFTNVEIELE